MCVELGIWNVCGARELGAVAIAKTCLYGWAICIGVGGDEDDGGRRLLVGRRVIVGLTTRMRSRLLGWGTVWGELAWGMGVGRRVEDRGSG